MWSAPNLRTGVLCHLVFLIASVAGFSGCSATPSKDQSAAKSTTVNVATRSNEDELSWLQNGVRLAKEKKFEEAISENFDKIIARHESGAGKQQFYCARSMMETVLYSGMAAQEHRDAIVLTSTWADAYFLKGNVLLDLGRVPEARSSLEKAVKLSPYNARYLSELAYTYELEKDWQKSLDTYKSAEHATLFSPEDQKTDELSRALRGEGYNLTELGQFDEAEAKYTECIKLDANDKKALNELEYIGGLKAKKAHQ